MITPDSFYFYLLIGKGSYGEVYLAELKEHADDRPKFLIGQGHKKQKLFAIKVQDKQMIQKNDIMKYMLTERNVLIKFDHPFIAKLHCSFQTSRYLFLAMDFYPGQLQLFIQRGDLSKLLQRFKKFNENVTKFYICEIVLALEALHRKNVMFRDLKPENIVLDVDGHCLLADFGLAKELGCGQSMSKSFCGSVAYLAPEMLDQQGHGLQIDWYLLGVLFYELLVGVPPYFSKDRQELFDNIRSGPLLIPKSLSQDAKDLIKGLLTRKPNRRLGHKTDSEEIKNHRFFRDVNWENVYKRKINPPLMGVREIMRKDMQMDFKGNERTSKQIPQVDDWYFEQDQLHSQYK